MTQKPIDADLVGITFNARGAIAQELKKRALERGVTQRCILHEGLKLLGFDVTEDDLQDRRGRPAKATDAAA